MEVILGLIIGFGIGIVLMCLLQVNRADSKDVKINEVKDYLHTHSITNSKGKSLYDKGYADALEYASVLIEEELQ